MANTLFIEWDLLQLRLVCGTVTGGTFTGEGVQVTLTAKDDTETLRTAIKTIGFTGDTADIVLPREVVSFRRLQLPTISDEELPAMVRLQAATKMTTSVSNLALDFVPMPYASDAGMREVMLITIPAESVKRFAGALSQCGITLRKIHAAPFVLANAAIADGSLPKSRDVQSLIVWVSGDRVDIVVVRNSIVEFAHSSTLSSGTDPAVLARSIKSEFNRARLTAGEQIERFAPSNVVVYAAEAVLPQIAEQLRKSIDDAELTERALDTSVLAALNCHDATALSLSVAAAGIISEGRGVVSDVDFCNPRKSIVKPDTRRQKVLLAVLASVCLFAAAWFWRESRISEIQAQESFVSGQLGEIRRTLKENNAVFKQAGAVDVWVKRDINWLDEIRHLEQVMPGTDRVYVRSFRFQSSRGGSDVGTIIAEGFAKSLADRDALGRTLREAGYGVESLTNTNNARLIDTDYPVPMTFTLSIPEGRKLPAESSAAADEQGASKAIAGK